MEEILIKTDMCCICRIEKNINEFGIHEGFDEDLFKITGIRPDMKGIKKHKSICIKCENEKQKELDEKNKQEIVKYESWRLSNRIRSSIRTALKINSKSHKTIELTGCTISQIYIHLKIKKYSDLKENHIDHIIPCAAYDLTDPEEQKKCFNWRNLRLLDARENIIKSNKIDLDLIKQYGILDLMPGKLL